MSDVTIKYKGQSIATMDASGTKTLQTQGKYCEGDIGVEYVKPAGPTGTKQISITANGTTTEDVAAYANAEITVDVQGGGGYTANDWLDPTKPTGAVVSNYAFSNNDYSNMLARRTGITSVSLPEATYLPGGFCARCTNLEEFYGPKIVTMWGEALRETKIKTIVLPSWTTNNSSEFYGCSRLTTVDRGGAGTINGTYTFRYCTSLSTLILRSTTMVALGGTGAFMITPFASGGSGGTIYVPQALIASYQAATNWSTILGYANNSIQAIEGSQYENYYADGTPIT